ncbi:MAG TPA: CocE/NonD family hydrolase, partial [Tahibacter sp.]|nr:CocE/NonD family hydrolase [Tahibacter sp.]
MSKAIGCAALLALAAGATTTVRAADEAEATPVDFQWGVKIPLRDGVKLNATLYRPQGQKDALPCVFTLTPYISQSYHDRGMYFAAHGYVYLTVDVRGRGNSDGEFTPLLQEARDGHDIVEWLAGQPYCNGKTSMWGGSYAGYNQWATAKEFPSHLTSIVPVASPMPGVDYPMRNNIFYPYDMMWLTFVSGRASQDKIFGDRAFWAKKFRDGYEAYESFATLDARVGNPSTHFQTWISHPAQDAYWDSFSPTPEQYAKLNLPILTVTGQYDGDQPGAFAFYDAHMKYGNAAAKAQHYLVIGPWDHAGTRTPQAEVDGVKFGPASLVDMNALHKAWYDWTLKGGAKPEFLKARVAYYVAGEEAWRYASTLEAITAQKQPYYVSSNGNAATDVYASGALTTDKAAARAGKSRYVYDPLDVSSADADTTDSGGKDLIDQRSLLARNGKQIVFHTAPFEKDTEVSGFFSFKGWISLDQPDTDIMVGVSEVKADGSSVYLAGDSLRARYRKSLREAKLATPGKVEPYEFNRFTFVSRVVKKGSRLRLMIAPINSMYAEKNYNAGGVVASESVKDARTVTVKLMHDAQHPSILYVPI